MTAVPPIIFGDKGPVAPTEAAILAGVQQDINVALGGGVNPGLKTPQGQIASTATAIIGDKNASIIWVANGVDPALNSGRMQDAIGRIYFMQRIPGQPSVQACICGGLVEVAIPVGALAVDRSNNLLWICQEAGTIPVSGTITLQFACINFGPTPGPAALEIAQTVFGWDTIVPVGDAVLGRLVESPAEFEARRAASVAANAVSILDAILGRVLAVTGVLDAYAVENDESLPKLVGGVILGPHSMYVAVLGGDPQTVANVIWNRKAPGCSYNGNTTLTVQDPNPQYVPPVPSYRVSYETPFVVNVGMLVVLKTNAAIPSTALAQIQTAIIAAFAGADGGTRAKIGSTVFASRYYATVKLLGSWAQIIDIQIGYASRAARIMASIAGTTMTVTAVAGNLAPGQVLNDAGLLASGTTIVGQLTGVTGQTGTYSVSTPQAVSSEAMTATELVNDITMNINQAPSIAAADIQLALRLS